MSVTIAVTPPISSEISAFLADRQSQRLSPRTILYYKTELGYFARWLESKDIHTVEGITPNLIREWLSHLAEKRNPGGCHSSYRSIKVFLRWLWTETDRDPRNNPIVKVKPPKVPGEILSPVSIETVRAMLDTCNRKEYVGTRDAAMLLALLDTGCRASEFVSLNIEDINLQEGTAVVKKGKGGKWRVVFFSPTTVKEILKYLRYRPGAAKEEPLWVTEDRNRLTYEGLRSMVRYRAQVAGIPAPTLHSFRRAFAILSHRQGADIISLQRMMGHTTSVVLQRYLKQDTEDLMRVHAATAPVESLYRKGT